jgi:hypothetical protein
MNLSPTESGNKTNLMSPDLQTILTLPKSQQLAIVQAILAQWQVEEAQPEVEVHLQQQLDLAETVAEAIDSKQMGLTSLAAFREKIQERRKP